MHLYKLRSFCYEYRSDWREASDDEWELATWGDPIDNFEYDLFKPEADNGKVLIVGHWHTSDFYKRLENIVTDTQEIYYSKNLIAIDGGVNAALLALEILAVSDDDLAEKLPSGKTRKTETEVRVNQGFFRSAVLSAYDKKCCITGLAIPSLLIASHIKPWAVSDPNTERTNPCNGLSLNALHHEAFDNGIFTIDTDYRVVVSKTAKERYTSDVFYDYFEITLDI